MLALSHKMPPFGVFDPENMSDVQKAFWTGLTDQRIANIWDASDYIADLSPEAREFLREAKPETLKFLRDAREFEIKELESGIEMVRAFRTAGRVVRWLIITVFGIIVGMILLWEKFTAIFARSK